jgi:ABC-type transport system involved in cytochrome c biogenesis ATPase subunit
MQVAEANQIALAALRAVLGAAHAFVVTIGDKAIHVSPRTPVPARWPKGPEGLDETKDGPWPPSVLLDCTWAGGLVTLELGASNWRASNRYRGQLAIQVATSPLNRQILWSTIAQQILDAGPGGRCSVPVSLILFARQGEKDTKRLLGSLVEQTRAVGLDSISPATFRLFDIVLKDRSVEPAPAEAFERVVRAALVKLPYVVRGEESDVTGALFIDVDRLRPSPLPPSPDKPPETEKPPLPEPSRVQAALEPAATPVEASTQENVFFDDVSFQNLAGFEHFGWGDIERLNVIVGANDTGKSHLLKILYALARSVEEYTARIESDRPAWADVLADKLLWTFQPPSGKLGELVRRGAGEGMLDVSATLCNEVYGFRFGKDTGRAASDFDEVTEDVRPQPGVSALFIPPKELLTSLDAIARVREQLKRFGFDDTYYDLVVALRGEPIQVDLPESFQRVLSDLEALLTGRIETDHGRFVFTRAGDRFDMPAVAEGIKKIGIFARLIQNGSLRRNSILFIDEPETNLHPRAARALVGMLHDLSRAGVQIYAATHSYFVLKQFEIIARRHKTPVRLCCLGREGDATQARTGIAASFFDLQDGMPDNGIVREALNLYDEDVDVGMES